MLNNNNSSIVQNGEMHDLIEVPLVTLDSELKVSGEISFIKIDVEGFEMHVLLGAEHTIRQHKPQLLIELHPGLVEQYSYTIEDIFQFLKINGYDIRIYSFMYVHRLGKLKRILNRWKSYPGKILDKETLVNEIKDGRSLPTYHLFCNYHKKHQ